MADTVTNPAQELVKAYNKAISSSFAAADAGFAQTSAAVNASFAQTSAAVKLLTGSAQAERDEYGKVMDKAASHARARGENIAAAMQGMAAMPVSTAPSFTPEAKDALNKLIEGEMTFYQAWTKSWMDYLSGAEARRSAAVKTMLENSAGAMESSQEVVKSAVKCGEAFIDWSMETAKVTKS